MGGVLEKDPAPHLTARQEKTVKLLKSHKAPFRRYPECFLCLVGLSPYYPFDDNSYPAFEHLDGTDMAGGSSSVAATEIPALTERGQKDVAKENVYLELADPDEGTAMVGQSDEDVVTEQPKKIKKKRLIKQSNVLPAKKLRTDHPSLASGTGGKTLAGLEQIMPAGSRLLAREQSATRSVAPPSQESEGFVDFSAQASLQIRTTVGSSNTLSAPVDTAAAITTFTKAKLVADVNPDLAGPSQLEESKGSDDSFYELATLDPSEAKRAARQICLGSEVRSHAEHELELKEKLNAKYATRGKLLEKKDSEILRLKSQLAEKEAKTRRLSVSKDHDISLLDSRATHLESALNDAQVACTEAGTKITSLASERDRLASEVSSLRVGFKHFKEKMEIQQEEQARELYNRMADLEAHVMDVSSHLEGEFYPTYLTLLAKRRWLLTHGIQLALLKCLKSSEYQGILGHALGWAVDFGMQEGLEAGHEHGVAGRSLSVVDAYNPEVASADYVNAVKALEDAHFPLVDLLKSKKDAGMDEVLDCFLLDGPLAKLPEAASLQLCIEHLSIPIHHADDKTAVGETSLSFALINVHARAEGAKKHAAALRQLMMKIVSAPLSSQTWVGEASISLAPLSVEDYAEEDTDEALGSVVAALILSVFIPRASLFFVRSNSAVRSVGMPISAGMTASVPYVSENGVSPLLDLIMVRCAHNTCKSSPIQSLLLSSNRALIPSPRLMFALSTKPFSCGCFTEAKHWRIHSFSHQSLNGLSQNRFPLSDTISPGRPNLQTMLSHTNFFTLSHVIVTIGFASIHLVK
ncbi:hypothetical protein Tco_0895168 [Tanacetum coccineum]|uniref:Transposase (Putative), gypsy type n=1 Tax=Tanacetum coccineum TaxID=301880 RepID=A0ABQ5CH99_9ASTR